MSFNGSGSFLINTAGQPVVSGTVISSTAFNALTADLATGLSTCITKDGQTTVTANIPMANYKFTGLGAGSGAADSANLSQVQSTVVKLLASVSGTDTITAVGSPTVAAYAAGQMFYFVAAGDNTGAVTINIDSLGAKAVTRDGSVALAAGDIKSGEVVVIVYDGTRFQVVSQLNSSGDARFANVSIASALNVGGVATVTGGSVLNGGVVINEPGADVDFRIEGDTDANLIFADASTDRVGIGTSSPATKLAINGGVQILAGNALNFQNAAADANGTISNSGASGNSTLSFNSGALLLNGSGNLGLGVTPSAWQTDVKAIQIGDAGSNICANNAAYSGANNVWINSNSFQNSSVQDIYIRTATAGQYNIQGSTHIWKTAPSGTAGNAITFTQAMTLDASGNLGVGTTSPGQKLVVAGNIVGDSWIGRSNISAPSADAAIYRAADNTLAFSTASTERARITSGGAMLVNKSSDSFATAGVRLGSDVSEYTVANNSVVNINRLSSDGSLIDFYQDTTAEGNISVSGTTVSYNGGHLSRYSQTTDNTRIPLLKGTVMSNLDQMAVWEKDGQPLPNEQLNCMKVSDVEGDVNVAGVFVNWDNDDDIYANDMNIAMTGDMIIRIAQGVVVQRGDLLMSAGDGTAKPQGDDIIRSKTVAKVTSNHVTCTYEDGSYCVPCVLMAC